MPGNNCAAAPARRSRVSPPRLRHGSRTATDRAERDESRPDILLMVADDVGYADTGLAALSGAHGSVARDLPLTPNLDAFASSDGAVVLDNFYVQPLCSASRAALLTGRYPAHTGMQTHVLQPQQRGGLPLDEVTLAERLKERGYATHMVGKWHLGYSRWAHTPRWRGFDTFFGMYTGASDHYNHRVSTTNHSVPDAGPLRGPVDLQRDETPVQHTAATPTRGVHSSDLYAEEALAILRQHADGRTGAAAQTGGEAVRPPPYFMMLAFQAAHDPIQTPPGWAEANAHITDPHRRQLAGLVSHLDAAIGRVLDGARAVGWASTLVLYMSDNGGVPYVGSSNFPFRGGKGGLWEGGVRTQLCVGGGALLGPTGQAPSPGPRVVPMLAHVSDLFPTILAAAGTVRASTRGEPPPRPAKPLDGFNLWPALRTAVASSGTAVGQGPRNEVLLNMDDVGYPLLPAPRIPTLHRRLRRTLASTLGWSDRSAALRVGQYKLVIGTPGSPFGPRVEHNTSDAATRIGASMAFSAALLTPSALTAMVPAAATLALVGQGGRAFGHWEQRAWLFDLEHDPAESVNLLLPGSPVRANTRGEAPSMIAGRMLARLEQLASTMAPPVNLHGTFSHGWREHVGYFPPRHGGHVRPYEEPDVPLRGAWLAYATLGTLLALALVVLPLLALLWPMRRILGGLRRQSRRAHAHQD
jgi:arylsulfatase A-like enzyme